jgi:hypothetical protein
LAVDIKNLLEKKRLFLRLVLILLFFSFCFFFLLFHIDPSVIFSVNGIGIHKYVSIIKSQDFSSYKDLLFRNHFILELTPQYLSGIAAAPGGWTKFIVTLFIYACHYPIAGSLFITGFALFFCWVFTLYIRQICFCSLSVLSSVPAFLVLTICAWYELSYLCFLLPVAGSFALALFYQRLQPDSFFKSVLLLTVIFWFSWYLMQWGAFLFLLWIVIYQVFHDKSNITPTAITVTVNGILLYFLESRFLSLSMATRWSDFTTLSGLPLIVIGFFPLSVIVLISLKRTFHLPEKISISLKVFLFICSFTPAIFWLYKDIENRYTRIIARTTHHIMNRQWENILSEKAEVFFKDFPEKAGPLHVFMVHAINQALCRTGQSGEKLFSFPQTAFSYDPLLMLSSMNASSYVNWFVVLDLAMDLGMVNMAEKITGELMENLGPYPEILYRRAQVQIAIGNKDAADVYLNKLSHMPFFFDKARRLLSMIRNNGNFLSEPRIASMNKYKDSIDYFLNNNMRSDIILKCLLQSNPDNKLAYDYLVNYCLLNNRIDEIPILISVAEKYGYTVLPRYWDEAYCLYQSFNLMQTSSTVSFSGVSQNTVKRLYKFTNDFLQMGKDNLAASKLASVHGSSYFFYFTFRYSPGGFN